MAKRSALKPPYGLAAGFVAAAIVIACLAPGASAAPPKVFKAVKEHHFLPGPSQSRVVTVSPTGKSQNEIIVMTEAVAIKETGPKETVAKFGEVYAFSPSFIAVVENQPTRLTFWNLQPDDLHDFMLADPDSNVLMYVELSPLSRESWIFTFHKPGLYSFYCALHQPAMSGQILVLPRPAAGKS